MSIGELCEKTGFKPLSSPGGDGMGRGISGVYCCDLLSVAMGKAPAGCAWVTVMGNLNVVAVCSLVDAACVIIADGAGAEERAVQKADQQGVLMLASPLPVFETAKLVDGLLHGE
ncbi:MAG: hypothetical protein LBJ10_12405 [Clostridiales bacterium]|nr:hypothetical protein [Clostridiales bacterium]